jgi:hypothetical protein
MPVRGATVAAGGSDGAGGRSWSSYSTKYLVGLAVPLTPFAACDWR